MTRNCGKCGGKYQRTDIESFYSKEKDMILYRDTDPMKANWKCYHCGDIRTQRKRQARKNKPVFNMGEGI